MNDVLLLEQSFADAAKAIEGARRSARTNPNAVALPLRQIAKA